MMLRGRIAVASAWLLLSTPLGAAAQRTQAVDGRLRDARAQLKSGHLDPAQRAVESVLERTPQSVAALLLLGEILEARKDLKVRSVRTSRRSPSRRATPARMTSSASRWGVSIA